MEQIINTVIYFKKLILFNTNEKPSKDISTDIYNMDLQIKQSKGLGDYQEEQILRMVLDETSEWNDEKELYHRNCLDILKKAGYKPIPIKVEEPIPLKVENKIELKKPIKDISDIHIMNMGKNKYETKQLKGKIEIKVNGGGDHKLMVRLSSKEHFPTFCEVLGLSGEGIDLTKSYEVVSSKSQKFNEFSDVPSYEMDHSEWIWFKILGKRAYLEKIKHKLNMRKIELYKEHMKFNNRGTTTSCWFPFQHTSKGKDEINGKYSTNGIYIISLGRFEYLDTAKSLEEMEQNYFIVVEPFEFDLYQDRMKDFKYGSVLSCGTNFHELKDGSKHVRNWVHRRNIKNGSTHYWLLDDNMRGFYRHHLNKYCKVKDGSCFYYVEKLQKHFKNVGICGLAYKSDTPAIDKGRSHLNVNSKVYSSFLIDVKLCKKLEDCSMNIWRGKYNEDIILCIDSLKKGLSTFTTSQYLCDKMTTGKRKGGNQKDLYKKNEKGHWDSKIKTDYLMETFIDLSKNDLITYSDRRGKKYHHYINWKEIERIYKVVLWNINGKEMEL